MTFTRYDMQIFILKNTKWDDTFFFLFFFAISSVSQILDLQIVNCKYQQIPFPTPPSSTSREHQDFQRLASLY